MADENSPIAVSYFSDDSPKVFLMGGLFEHIPVPEHESFEQEKPEWMTIANPGEK